MGPGSSRSPTPNRSRERGRSSGKPPLSDDDQWPLCAHSGHSPTALSPRRRRRVASRVAGVIEVEQQFENMPAGRIEPSAARRRVGF